MRMIRAAETTKVTAFATYDTSGDVTLSRTPPRSGPSIQVRFSTDWKSAFACGRSSSSTRFGIPA